MPNDITVTAAQVAPCFIKFGKAEIYDFLAGETLTAGLAVYIKPSDGLVYKADANDSADTAQFRGITLEGAGAGQAVSVLMHGCVYGFTLSGLNYDDLVWLSDTAGAVADDDSAAGIDVIVGRVFPLPDADVTKVLFVDVDMAEADWS